MILICQAELAQLAPFHVESGPDRPPYAGGAGSTLRGVAPWLAAGIAGVELRALILNFFSSFEASA